MTQVDVSRAFMLALNQLEKRDIGPIDSAALAATVVLFQQNVVYALHMTGELTDEQRDKALRWLEETL